MGIILVVICSRESIPFLYERGGICESIPKYLLINFSFLFHKIKKSNQNNFQGNRLNQDGIIKRIGSSFFVWIYPFLVYNGSKHSLIFFSSYFFHNKLSFANIGSGLVLVSSFSHLIHYRIVFNLLKVGR